MAISKNLVCQESLEARHHAEKASELAAAGDLQQAEVEFGRAVQLAPKQPAYLAAFGTVLAMRGSLERATRYFEKALQLDPTNAKTRRDLAASQWQLGRLRAATANLQQVLRRTPGDRQAVLLLGMVAENSKDYANAARRLASVEEELKQHPEAVAALIHSYYELDEQAKARRAFEGLMYGQSPDTIFLVAKFATQAKDYEFAEKMLASIRPVYLDRRALEYQLASIQFRTRRFPECRKTLLDLIKSGQDDGAIYNLLGRTYEAEGQPREAIRALNRAIELDAANESNYLDLTKILLDQNEFTSAQEVARKVTELFPASFLAYDVRGTAETRASDFAAAVTCYARAVELEPHNAKANLLLGQAQEMAGMRQAAERTLRRGMRRFPRDASHFQEYALMLLKDVQPGDSATRFRAAGLLQRAIRLDPELSESHYQLGNLWMEERHTSEALRELESAERLQPGSSKVHYALWRAYRRQGREQDAAKERKLFESAITDEESSLRRSPEPATRADQR
jgi:tetratricopeptide (TPR) repeat protein